jgi:hypothetical protein
MHITKKIAAAVTNVFRLKIPPPSSREAALQVKGQRKKVKGLNCIFFALSFSSLSPLYPFTLLLYPSDGRCAASSV